MRKILIILLVLCSVASAQETIFARFRATSAVVNSIGPADTYTDLGSTTATTTLTAAILNNASSTRGITNSGNWAAPVGTAPVAATHVTNCGLGGNVQVDGTVYDTSHTSLAMSFDNTTTLNHIDLATPSVGYKQDVILVCVTIGANTIAGSNVMDIIRIDGSGHASVVQLSSANCGGSLGTRLEDVAAATNASSCIALTSGNSYWFVLFHDGFASTPITKMAVFNSSFAQVGSTIQACSGCSDINAATWTDDIDHPAIIGNDQTGTATGVNKFENLIVRYSGFAPFLSPQNTTQVPVYWVARSHNNHGSGGTTSVSTTKAIDEHAGDTVVVSCSNENASGQTTSVSNTATETFTSAASVKSAANGQSISQWVTFPASDHATQTYTCNFPSSAFSNIDVQIIRGSTAFDTGAVGNTASGANITSGSFTPSTSTGSNVACAYIQAGQAITPGTNYVELRTSATDSMGCQFRPNAPNSSQTATGTHSNTSASMISVGNYKQ